MMSKADKARQLLTNPLMGELFEEFDSKLYNDWRRAEIGAEQSELVRGQAIGVRNFYIWLRNRCEAMANEQ